MSLTDQTQHLGIDLRGRSRRAGQGRITTQVGAVHRLERHHVVLLAHAETRDHRTSQPCGLLDIVGGPRGNRPEDLFLGGPSARKGYDAVEKRLAALQQLLALLDLHGIAECPGGTGYNGDLVDRCRMALQGCDQRMADLVIGHNTLLFGRKHLILLLRTGNYGFDTLFKISRCYQLASHAHGPQRRLVDDVGQLGS